MLVIEYKIQAKPKQYKAIDDAIRTVQFIRNKAIRYWMEAPKDAKINRFALNKYSTELRNVFAFVKDLNSMAVQASAERGWLTISRFYDARCSSGKPPRPHSLDNCKSKKTGSKGFPRFQKDNRSVEYKTSGWSLHKTKRRITITDKKGIGELKLLGKWDIHQYDVKSIKRVRLVRRADGYYCQFAVDVECVDIGPETGNEIGLDVGIESFYTDSNGHQEPNPKFLRKAEDSIKKSQRNEHAKRLARNVCKSNDLVAYVSAAGRRLRRTDLRVANMVKNYCLAKSISDASWYQFRQWIEYFAAKFGKLAIAVPSQYTSQECSRCKVIVKKSLSTRTHVCACGLTLQRDWNAAINILLKACTEQGRSAKSRDGQSRSNANGDGTSTLLGLSFVEVLVEQVLSVKLESHEL